MMKFSNKHPGKKGKLTSETINKAVLAIVIIIVLFGVYAVVIPEVGSAGDLLNNSNRCNDASGFWNNSGSQCQINTTNSTLVSFQQVPLNSLFSSNGVALLIVMAALLILVVLGLFKGKTE